MTVSLSPGSQRAQGGFSLVELLIVIAIIGVLSMLGTTAFWIYKDRAEYAKGESTMRNVRVNAVDGDLEAADGLFIGLTTTDRSGGPMPAGLDEILPGAVTPPDLVLAALYDSCDAGDPPMQVKQLISVAPCRSVRSLRWTKFCNGLELLQGDLPGGCP